MAQHCIITCIRGQDGRLDWPKKKRVSNQTADGSAPVKKDMRKHDWAITTTIEVDGKHYVVPVQV